ncbi:MAG: bifunctional nuclease domain-containing protein [Bacteroidota bacterium]
MEKIKLDIVALSHSVTQSHNYAVVLGEQNGNRRLPIVIGGFEAQAIAVAMEKMSPNRPLTHDLFRNTLESFDITLKEIVINNLLDGIFYAQLICEKNGEEYEIDSRTSDAIAMAVRFDCPIYTFEFIMETAGVVLEDSEGTISAAPKRESPPKRKTLAEYSVADLNAMLEKVLAEEDYEKAARIRDELNNRK